MTNIPKLIEIAQSLGLREIAERLEILREREAEPNTELIIPLVGEFSSGKTTLLNALTSGKKLETARERTTATIFEVYFSQEAEHAVIFWEDGTQEEVSDISKLKNDHLGNAKMVRVYDTSPRIPGSTIIVDTPGLSSPVPKDREALTAYLPRADVVLVVIDINSGDITRSLLEFMKAAELARRRVYIIVTKSDTKAASEQEAIRVQVGKTLNFPVENIACVSVNKGEIDEVLHIIAKIQNDKNKIVAEVTEQQAEAIQKNLLEQVALLLKSSQLSTDELDKQIAEAKHAENEMRLQIRRMVSNIESFVESAKTWTVSDFNRRISGSLEGVVKNPPEGQDINQAARAIINSIASLMYANFKTDVYKKIRDALRAQFEDSGDLSVSRLNTTIQSVDSANELPVDIDLSLPELQKAGKLIAGALKTVVVVAAAAATKGISEIVATGAAQIASNGIEGLIGEFIEHTFAKPQRQRLIDDYIISNLQPEFKTNLEQISRAIIGNIETMLVEDSRETMAELKNNLEQLKAQKLEARGAFQEKVTQLKAYNNILLTYEGEKQV